jgi:hypothetical protein
MQYSAASFSQPMSLLMSSLIRSKTQRPALSEYFPANDKTVAVQTPDWIQEYAFRPLFLFFLGIANLAKQLQHGRVNGYILYILLTLVLLLTWKVGSL